MIKYFAAAATCLSLATTAGFADGSHSHTHSHPHDGHGHFADDAYQHSHEEDVTNATHTHEVNGVTVTHTHRKLQTAAEAERFYSGRFQVGAGFGPYSVAEYQARVAAGQPGIVRRQEPWPTRRYRNQN